MKYRNLLLSVLLLIVMWPASAEAVLRMLSLEERLKTIPEISELKKLRESDHFTEKYEFKYEQYINPNDTALGTFKQYVVLCHSSFASPVVVGLEGYEIWTNKAYELTKIIQANQLSIEHRFFRNSQPEGSIPWEHLTIANAANDQHKIIQKIKRQIYPQSKFVSTGISKGGQTTMIHRSIYPDDVDASVCYVAPLNFEREDPRIYQFLDTVGTQEERDRIADFQTRCLKKKRKLVKMLGEFAEKNHLEWEMSLEEAFEYYVLEYSFAYWQWGNFEMDQIPGKKVKNQERLSHLLAVSGVSFFEKKGVDDLRPYFWAALTEEGIYGYQHEDFAKWLSKEETYVFDFTAPEGTNPTFNPQPMKDLNEFIQTEATEMMFIYGGYDTWYATGVQLDQEAKARGLVKYVMPGGHHDTRIRSFPQKTQDEIIETINLWLD